MKTYLNKMGRLLAIAGAVLLACPAMAADALPIRVPTVETLAQFPGMTGFRISPDGKHMLAIQSQGDNRSILVWALADLGAKPTVIGAKNMQIASASFLKNDMLQVSMTQPYDLRTDEVIKTFINKLLFTDLEGKNWIEPMAATDIARSELAKKAAALANPIVLSRMLSDPDNIVLESGARGESRDVFRYNLRTGKATRIMRLGESDNRVFVNSAGLPWAKSRLGSDGQGTFTAIDFRGKDGEWTEHFRSYVKNRDVVDVAAPGAKPDTAIIRSNVGREFTGLYEYDIANRKVAATLFEHKYFDATGVRSFRNDDGPSAEGFDGYAFNGHLGNDVHWDNPKMEAAVRGVAQALGIQEVSQELVGVGSGERAEIRSFDGVSVRLLHYVASDAPTYLFSVSGSSYPTEFYLLRGQSMQLLAKEYPDIDRRALGTSRFVYYKARDGLNIPAYVTVPNPQLCGPGPYAAVVHPHGGPWARDTMDYDWSGWVPMLASQCRVVLRPQFRGSEGWGRTLWFAGDREWGQKMQDDKDDGAKWLISEKLADPKRIAMFGFSYGGYSAFTAAVRPNGLYKCAIAGAGVSDIDRIWAKFFTNPYFQSGQEPTVRGLSPLSKADKIEIPIMVYHGERDQVVPIIQSELFVDKAKAAGKPVEYHVLKDYAHGPAWTRKIMADQLNLISNYLGKGCGTGGL
ncbi:prolyl oligopeptidase family serine peptidase [Roseateles sp.]|uniref:alpha/beta hydrolase family protein n=1 Tax=Roseateles sp. TaxID=1971397 RepID=UPI0032675E30